MFKPYKYLKELTLQKKIGIILLFLILIINQNVWIWFFDNDGYLKEINKIKFLIIDFILLTIGLAMFFMEFQFNPKKVTKWVFYIVYLILSLELISFLTIKVLFFSNKNLERNINNYLSDTVSKFIPDLRSDYKPNKNHPDVNKFGFRSGGKPDNKGSFRIMCIGGSTTWGDGAKDSSSTYPAQLEFFLESKGYHINVINAGVPYHTSLDVLMRFISKGIYFKPDMLLIHTGLNDNGAVQSPFPYQADYSHWRKVKHNNKDIYLKLWNEFPFSIFRLFFIFYFNFDSHHSVSYQTSNVQTELVSKIPFKTKRTEGLKNYFSSILAISKANNIIPVTIKINNDHNRNNSYAKRFFKNENLEYAIQRDKNITDLHNFLMDSISVANKVKVIHFNEFEPSSKDYWYDNCHLTEAGLKEKAIFIGNYLMNEFNLPKK
tara:strand:- start:2224 stop:3522 length:1299 start_codon:yes stop_codon:yes gene_type:complete